MKKLILSLLFITLSVVLVHGQTALYSLYMFNPYILNPGVAGISNHVEISAGYRNQWVNFEGAPTTYYLTAHAPLDKRSARYGKKDFNHSAVGGMLFVDQYGQLMELGGSGSYTLHIALNKQYKLSLGGAIGFRQYSFDRGKMTIVDQSDNILNNLKNKYTFDGTFGGWLYGKNMYLGVSGTNLLSFSNFAYNNCFAMGGYRYQANSRLEVLPSLLARLSPTVDPQFDFNCKLRYDKALWGGASFRTNRTFVLMGGFKWNNTLSVGYAYDTPWNYVKNFQSASHEIFVQFELRNHKVICPEFW
jgi:type IX secretion system PorP/SprF family membrane protein